MIKKLKKKFTTGQPHIEYDGGILGLDCKTQRLDIIDHNNISKETIRKDMSTERKIISTKSPKHNPKLILKNAFEKSPKKSTRNNSSQF